MHSRPDFVPAHVDPASTHVIVGMSGGVDSSVAAHLLKQAGFQVTGLFMKNWDEDDGTEYCTAKDDLAAASMACERLGLELTTANFAAEYWDDVFHDFLTEYRAGRTPNPDILCNREIKFKQFVDYAGTLGADFIATGHYSGLVDGRLVKALDESKDQTYFLQAVPKAQLQRCLFPLAAWHKSEVRTLAARLGLDNHDRKDSTGICFIGERRFDDFLRRYIQDTPGPMFDEHDREVGRHAGLHLYTIGQRQGLGLGGMRGRSESPWYVLAKEPGNVLRVTQNEVLLAGRWLLADEINWLEPPSGWPLQCQAKIRYRQSDQACWVRPAPGGGLSVEFVQPQRAITRGQYIALYAQDTLIAGGRIVEHEPWRANL
ncbi:MAG: tRNA 2-thiouridine(34) synthase MnmA [Pseudomonadota bacterium]